MPCKTTSKYQDIKYLPNTHTNSVYGAKCKPTLVRPDFSLVTKTDDGIYEQVCYGNACKTYIHDAICSSIINKESITRKINFPSAKNFRKTRLLVGYSSEGQAIADSEYALRILRSLEKLLHFKRSRTIQSLNNVSDMLFLISSRWFHNPIALSLYTSVVRMVTVGPVKRFIDNNKELDGVGVLTRLAKKLTEGVNYGSDSYYIRNFVNTGAFSIFLDNDFSELFSRKTVDNFTAGEPRYLHEPGISSWSMRQWRATEPWNKWKDITELKKKALNGMKKGKME